jgi:hypothetical protein
VTSWFFTVSLVRDTISAYGIYGFLGDAHGVIVRSCSDWRCSCSYFWRFSPDEKAGLPSADRRLLAI